MVSFVERLMESRTIVKKLMNLKDNEDMKGERGDRVVGGLQVGLLCGI